MDTYNYFFTMLRLLISTDDSFVWQLPEENRKRGDKKTQSSGREKDHPGSYNSERQADTEPRWTSQQTHDQDRQPTSADARTATDIDRQLTPELNMATITLEPVIGRTPSSDPTWRRRQTANSHQA